jgi:hypothetical protein
VQRPQEWLESLRHSGAFSPEPVQEESVEDNSNSTNLQNDVLHFEHHSTLSAEDIAKAVQRHNREHKGDAQKAVRQAKMPGKKH